MYNLQHLIISVCLAFWKVVSSENTFVKKATQDSLRKMYSFHINKRLNES